MMSDRTPSASGTKRGGALMRPASAAGRASGRRRSLCEPRRLGAVPDCHASGRSSRPTIHTMAPAAKPSAAGRTALNCSTNRNAGTARSGCGRLEKTLQPAAFRTGVPRGTSTRLIARPSGMFWMAIATAIRSPKVLVSPKAAPMPIPSAAECAVITPTTSNAFRASDPRSVPRRSSFLSPTTR